MPTYSRTMVIKLLNNGIENEKIMVVSFEPFKLSIFAFTFLFFCCLLSFAIAYLLVSIIYHIAISNNNK